MSFRKPDAPAGRDIVAVAHDYQEQFIRDAHVIVAEGYARLDPATLGSKREPDISGLIVTKSRSWMDQPESPEWTKSYWIVEEKHEDESALEGMNRPRIDIHIESAAGRPRPCFKFEAKRLYRSDSVAEYAGRKGLGALCDGTYASSTGAAGMLGYVQQGDVEAAAKQVAEKLDRERSQHGLSPKGSVWREAQLDPRLGKTRWSEHVVPGRSVLRVYHSFLKCCA